VIGTSIGNYKIVAKLGEGGMGTVYLGEHPLIGKRVAIKVLLEELASNQDVVSRFFTEARAVTEIGHPNIVDVVDFGRLPIGGRDVVYFIMEFLEGESLHQRLRRAGLTFSETVHVMDQCCAALAASHKKGIVHRDLKPENIYLCPRGADPLFVKILDFGIAKLTGDAGSSSKTRTGTVIGTPTYMSPEQCEGKGRIDHRSDIYSLGVLMYELLTGRVPFEGDGFGEILVAHLTRQPALPSTVNAHVPADLEAIVMRALDKNRDLRFQTMEELQAALRAPAAYAQSRPAAVTMPAGTPPVWSNQGPGPRPTTLSGAAAELRRSRSAAPRRGPFVAGIVGGLLLVGGIVGGVLYTRGSSTPAAPPPQPPPQVAAAKVKVRLETEPPGAKVVRAGYDAPIGTTPLSLEVDRGSEAFQVQFRLDGYLPREHEVHADADQSVQVALTPQPVPEPTEPAPPPARTPTPPPTAAKAKAVAKSTAKPDRPKPKLKKKGAVVDDGSMDILEPSFAK
jgi:serine/threonine-protein kinase